MYDADVVHRFARDVVLEILSSGVEFLDVSELMDDWVEGTSEENLRSIWNESEKILRVLAESLKNE